MNNGKGRCGSVETRRPFSNRGLVALCGGHTQAHVCVYALCVCMCDEDQEGVFNLEEML